MKRKPALNTKIAGSDAGDPISNLVTKRIVASAAGVSVRTVDSWVRSKRISSIKLSARCIRFDLSTVLRELRRFTVEAAN